MSKVYIIMMLNSIEYIFTNYSLKNIVHRVFNQWSHQNTKSQVPVDSKTESSTYPPALEERLSSTEKILGINKPVPRDVYERLKTIEDRLSFLESISPEYKDLWVRIYSLYN